MKQPRIKLVAKTKEQKKPKGMYYLAAALLIAIGCTGFINTRKAAMEDEINKSYSMVTPEDLPSPEIEIPYAGEIAMPDIPVIADDDREKESEKQESAPVSAKDIKFTLPVSGVIAKDYSQDNLIYNKTFNDWRTHSGIDIGADIGTSVKAAAAGTVESITDDPLYGTTVTIRHSDTLITKYSNLQPSLPVSTGNFVEAGAPIGNISESAPGESSEGPHLHFEIIENDKPINPKDFFN